MNETEMVYEHHPLKVVTKKGSSVAHLAIQTTMVACMNAVGQAIPPYVVYNAKTLHPGWMANGVAGA